jgi:hypothetical protein
VGWGGGGKAANIPARQVCVGRPAPPRTQLAATRKSVLQTPVAMALVPHPTPDPPQKTPPRPAAVGSHCLGYPPGAGGCKGGRWVAGPTGNWSWKGHLRVLGSPSELHLCIPIRQQVTGVFRLSRTENALHFTSFGGARRPQNFVPIKSVHSVCTCVRRGRAK